MAKKKTRVMLPGGIQGLVHDLQNGTSTYAQRPVVEEVSGDDVDGKEQLSAGNPGKNAGQGGGVGADAPAVSVAEAAPGESGVAARPAATEGRERGEETPAAPAQTAGDRGGDRESQGGAATPSAAAQPELREYHIVKDDSKDSWDLFLDMARQYKSGDGKLATIYIDETLKSVLDRMKYAGSEKLSTSAILSSIVARFIYDHEDEIRKVLFSGDLI